MLFGQRKRNIFSSFCDRVFLGSCSGSFRVFWAHGESSIKTFPVPYQGSAKYRHRNRPAALLSHHPVHVTSDARLYIHPCMQSLSPHSEREETRQQHRRFLLAKGTFFHLLFSPSGSSQLFFPGPLERIKRVTWLAIGPGVRIYLRKIVFGVCVLF